MAGVDTGLGWFADSAWLRDTQGLIGTLDKTGGGSGSSEFYELPKDRGNRAVLMRFSRGWYSYWAPLNSYGDAVYCALCQLPGYPNPHQLYISKHSSTFYYFSPNYSDQSVPVVSLRTGKDYYYSFGYTYEGPIEYRSPPLHLFNSEAEMWEAADAFMGTTQHNYRKSTDGYSVTCMCRWITSYGGDIYFSPVLISSVENYTLFTRDNSTPSVSTTTHVYQGTTFYMRKAPFDILVGSEQITSPVPIIDLSGVAQTNDTIFSAIAFQSKLGVGYAPGADDPYGPGGTSRPGGGTDTDFDITGDTILDSPLPTFSFANSGFARIYNPNLSQLQSLANYLWTDTNFLQTIVNHAKQLLEDPIESIITLNRLPISVPNGTAEVVKVLFIPTNTSMPPVTNQFVDVDCGTLQIKHEYDSALDYNPYTDISLVLPFIGVVQIDPDEVMDKTLSLTYRVDVVSGMCVAKVAVDGCVLYQYSGNCAISMPFNSADFSNYISAMVTAAKSIAGVAAAGAAGAVAAAAEGTGVVKAKVAEAPSAEPEPTGSSLPKSTNKSTNIFKETFGRGGIGEGTLKAAKKGVANTVSAVVSSKRTIEHAGHFSGNSGFLGVRRPYAIIKRPKMCNPEEYGRFNGRPCMMYLHLGNLSGYTEVQEIHLTGILATNDELIEIENLLKSGVIL